MATAVLVAAFLAVAAALVPGAAADMSCINDYSAAKKRCASSYTDSTANKPNTTTTCDALTLYFACIDAAISCDKSLAGNWDNLVKDYTPIWKDKGCAADLHKHGALVVGVGWGDPHYYSAEAGLVTTCGGQGWFSLFRTLMYTVEVNHAGAPWIKDAEGSTTDGTIINAVKVKFVHPSSPRGTYYWDFTSSPSLDAPMSGVKMSATGVTAYDVGLDLSIINSGGYYTVGLKGYNGQGGTLVDGCGTPINPGNTPDECNQFGTGELKQACAFDAGKVNVSFAVKAAKEAVSMMSSMGISKGSGVTAAASGLAAAVFAVAVAAALF